MSELNPIEDIFNKYFDRYTILEIVTQESGHVAKRTIKYFIPGCRVPRGFLKALSVYSNAASQVQNLLTVVFRRRKLKFWQNRIKKRKWLIMSHGGIEPLTPWPTR